MGGGEFNYKPLNLIHRCCCGWSALRRRPRIRRSIEPERINSLLRSKQCWKIGWIIVAYSRLSFIYQHNLHLCKLLSSSFREETTNSSPGWSFITINSNHRTRQTKPIKLCVKARAATGDYLQSIKWSPGWKTFYSTPRLCLFGHT